MKVLITEDKLQSLFNSMMLDYSKLNRHVKVYDYYDYDKGRYIDYSPLNFYNRDEDDDDSWWELDDWVFQYAHRPPYGIPVEGFEIPLLIYHKGRFKSMIQMFGDKFEDLLKNWFESTYDMPVNYVVDDYSAEEFVRS